MGGPGKVVKEAQQSAQGDHAMCHLSIGICRQVRRGVLARVRELLGDAAFPNITPAIWTRFGQLLLTKTCRPAGEAQPNPSDQQLERALQPYANLPDLEMDGEILESKTRGAPRGKGTGLDQTPYEIIKLSLCRDHSTQ